MANKALSPIVPSSVTTTQRDALSSSLIPAGSLIWNSTASSLQVNTGTGSSPVWYNLGSIQVFSQAQWPPSNVTQNQVILLQTPNQTMQGLTSTLGGSAPAALWPLQYRPDLDSTYPWTSTISSNTTTPLMVQGGALGGYGNNSGGTACSFVIPVPGMWAFASYSAGMQTGGSLNDFVQVTITDSTTSTQIATGKNFGAQGTNTTIATSCSATAACAQNDVIKWSYSGSNAEVEQMSGYIYPVKLKNSNT